MVLSLGKQPAHFTLDPSLGEFVLTTPAMSVPDKGNIYSVNEGNSILWDEAVSRCTFSHEMHRRGAFCVFAAMLFAACQWRCCWRSALQLAQHTVADHSACKTCTADHLPTSSLTP